MAFCLSPFTASPPNSGKSYSLKIELMKGTIKEHKTSDGYQYTKVYPSQIVMKGIASEGKSKKDLKAVSTAVFYLDSIQTRILIRKLKKGNKAKDVIIKGGEGGTRTLKCTDEVLQIFDNSYKDEKGNIVKANFTMKLKKEETLLNFIYTLEKMLQVIDRYDMKTIDKDFKLREKHYKENKKNK